MVFADFGPVAGAGGAWGVFVGGVVVDHIVSSVRIIMVVLSWVSLRSVAASSAGHLRSVLSLFQPSLERQSQQLARIVVRQVKFDRDLSFFLFVVDHEKIRFERLCLA